MVLGRTCAMMVAVLALAGCASGGYYSDGAYYDGPYYGTPYYGGIGYSSDFDHHHHSDRYFHPMRGVTCDRARDICYDRDGDRNHEATKRYFDEHDAKKYRSGTNLFSPEDGVICNRSKQRCTSDRWTDRIFGDADRFTSKQDQFWRQRSKLNHDDKPADRHASQPWRSVDNDDLQRSPGQQPEFRQRPRFRSSGQFDGAGGYPCPPKGCSKR